MTTTYRFRDSRSSNRQMGGYKHRNCVLGNVCLSIHRQSFRKFINAFKANIIQKMRKLVPKKIRISSSFNKSLVHLSLRLFFSKFGYHTELWRPEYFSEKIIHLHTKTWYENVFRLSFKNDMDTIKTHISVITIKNFLKQC